MLVSKAELEATVGKILAALQIAQRATDNPDRATCLQHITVMLEEMLVTKFELDPKCAEQGAQALRDWAERQQQHSDDMHNELDDLLGEQ